MIIRWWWKKRNVVRRYFPNWIKYNSCLVPVVYISWSSFHFWWCQIVKGIFVQFCKQGALRGFWQYSKGTLGVFGENMLVPCEVVFESRIFESQVFESAVFESQGSNREMHKSSNWCQWCKSSKCANASSDPWFDPYIRFWLWGEIEENVWEATNWYESEFMLVCYIHHFPPCH